MKHHASPVISSEGVHRIYIRPVFALNFLRLASLPILHFPLPHRTGSFFTNSYLLASWSIFITMFAKFIVAFLALSTLANAAPATRTSRLASCVVDTPAHLSFASGRGVSVAIDGHPIHLRDLDAAPAMRTSRLASCVVDAQAHLFLP